ncbi:hypothetical protein RJ640_003281 [Escallonia rubra]|uniref:Protein FAR1-RELATED SEQUENCE n=1 Tax=Escallonia rubra TaxID=112253 RepID=A0AA88TYK1_9ASTE|nr:hypothetical protein RJ640_003281 [Escallonia rubra]
MSKMQKGDVSALLEYFQKMKLRDPSFSHSIQLDENDLITNIFWADSRLVVDCKHFRDVVCFDTNYQTNGHLFAPFLGVNHHKQIVIFGVALLDDDIAESFKWLFRIFLGAMSEKQPKTILIDQSIVMANSIVEVFHETNIVCDEDEWMLAWNQMVKTYSLQDNDWLEGIFELKEKWAMVYGRHIIHKVSKSENISDYKVVYGGKGREHLVKFEAETTTTQCSCMKFRFVGILCRHALKVLDKKNIKIIALQYILKRWTKDAKDAIVSDYRGAQVQGNYQESGKQYSYLSHDFQELVTLAAENEDVYTYVHQNLSKLLKDLEEMKKTYCSSTLDPDTNTQDDLPRNMPQLNNGAVSQCPGGLKKSHSWTSTNVNDEHSTDNTLSPQTQGIGRLFRCLCNPTFNVADEEIVYNRK